VSPHVPADPLAPTGDADHAAQSPPPGTTAASPAEAPRPRPEIAEADRWNWFSAEEQALQTEFRRWRDRWAAPLVRACRRLGITADLVSAAALAMLIPFGVGLLSPATSWGAPLAVLSLVLHVLLDGLDGPLARAAHSAGTPGAFTDMCADHTGFLIITTLLAIGGQLSAGAAAAYISSGTMSIAMIVTLNLLRRPLRWVLRTKYPFYALVSVALLGGPDWLTPAAIVFSGIHGGYAVIGFIAVRRALRG
jgi:phosphatidylglycerophosphate synthase